MKRTFLFCTILLLTISATFVTGCGKTGLSKTNYTIATGSKSGVYFPVGETLAKILKDTYPDATINVIETAGSVQNLQMLNEGKVDMALVQNDIAFYAAQGEKMFDTGKITTVTGIATIFPEVVQIIVRKDSEITSLTELASKTISIGSKNSGTYYNSKQILSEAGVWESITQKHLSFSEAIAELEAGTIDGFVFTSGIPNPSITQLSSKVDISIVPVSPEIVQKLVSNYSFYFPSTIPENQYKGQDVEVSAVEINAIMISGNTLSENDQYLLTKALFGKPNDMGKKNPRLSKLTKNSLRRQMPIALGKGAYKAHSEIQ